MSYVIAAPEMLATAAADVDGIGSAIRAASASAAGPTTGLLAAAADEVSSAAAALFSEYARECQEVLKQAAAFHGEFTRALAAAGAAYAQAEASRERGQLVDCQHRCYVGHRRVQRRPRFCRDAVRQPANRVDDGRHRGTDP